MVLNRGVAAGSRFLITHKCWGSASLCRAQVTGVVRYLWHEPGKDKSTFCVYLISDEGWSVCGWMGLSVYAHTHTHCMWRTRSPGVRTRHLESPKNPDGLNLGIHVFVHVHKVHFCTYMPGGEIRSWTTCVFGMKFFSSEKENMRIWSEHQKLKST